MATISTLGALNLSLDFIDECSQPLQSGIDDDHDADLDAQRCRGVQEGEIPPSVFGHVLDAHQLEPQSAYAIEDSVEV